MGGGDKDILFPPPMEEAAEEEDDAAAVDDISDDWHHVTEAEAAPPPSLQAASASPAEDDAVAPRENETETETETVTEQDEENEAKQAEAVENDTVEEEEKTRTKEKTTTTTEEENEEEEEEAEGNDTVEEEEAEENDNLEKKKKKKTTGQRDLTTTSTAADEGVLRSRRSRVLQTKPSAPVAGLEDAAAKEAKTRTTTKRSLLVPLCSFLLVFGGTLLMLVLLPGFRFSSQAASPAAPVQPPIKKPEAVVQPPPKAAAGMKVAYVQHVKEVAVKLDGLLAEKLHANNFARQRNTMAAQSHQHLLALHTALGKGSAKLLKQMVKAQKKRMVPSLEAATHMLADHLAKTAAHAVEKKRHLFFIGRWMAEEVREVRGGFSRGVCCSFILIPFVSIASSPPLASLGFLTVLFSFFLFTASASQCTRPPTTMFGMSPK
jgi:hypothetical protein